MSRIRSFAVLVCVLSAATAWAAPFMDDFDRPNGNVGNGWSTQTNGTITVQIVDGEVLVAGTQGTDWVRCGISRAVADETRISFDFRADDSFNVHIRVDSADSSAFVEVYTYPGGPLNHANSPDGAWPGWVALTGPNVNIVNGQYNNLVLEQDGTTFIVTLNGAVAGTITNSGFTSIENVLISSDSAAGTTGSLRIDNVQIGEPVLGTAENPSPATGAGDVPQDVVLGWTPGEFAATHDVYFGTTMEDVASASRTDSKGVLASQGQTAAEYATVDLEYGQTYYWRVDEVNAAPDNTVVVGGVWSFTVEPFVYPITGVTATASSAASDAGPENTVNGSGLNANDEHSVALEQMWLSGGGLPSWIQYEFDGVYKLEEMWVWNSNQLIESFVGFGAKDVTIEYSVDGETWTMLAGVSQFAQGPGSATYAAGTLVDFAGAMARFVKVTINANWGGVTQQTGLSEVRFYYVPVQARGPQPAVGATDVAIDTELSWRQGREAESHEVLLGTAPDALVQVGTPTAHAYAPASLDFGTTYYWQVNEVGGDGGPYEGDLWSFTTQEFATIDGMESYDDDDNRIYETWIDGLTTLASGSQVGYDVSPFAERSIVHGGEQSMPFLYDNTAAPFLSEAEREFAPAQNWTLSGADTLSLWVQGNAAGFVEEGGTITMGAGGHDIWDNADDFRFAYKQLTGDGSILVKVESIVNTNAWAKAGVMIRQSLDADSKFVYMIESFSSGVSMGWRPTTAAACGSTTQAGITAPQWVKLTRKGDVFTAQYSANGTTWTDLKDAAGTIASTTVAMTNPVYIGLCVTSHNAAATTTAVMSGAAASGNVTGGSWQALAIGDDPQPANAPADLYVTLGDSTGKTATVANATAVTTGAWTQWQIPLSDFAGVNLTRVNKLILGVDSRNQATKGTGIIYVDDIGVGHPVAP